MLSPESCFLREGEDWEGKLSLDFNSCDFLGLGIGLSEETEISGSFWMGASGEEVKRCKPVALAIFFLRNLIFDEK